MVMTEKNNLYLTSRCCFEIRVKICILETLVLLTFPLWPNMMHTFSNSILEDTTCWRGNNRDLGLHGFILCLRSVSENVGMLYNLHGPVSILCALRQSETCF